MKTHGMSKTPVYRVWGEMIQRCHNPNNHKYRWYGARGIKVCDEWRADFTAFAAYMGPRHDGMSIDRIDPDRGYEPGNVRWATQQEQLSHLRPRTQCVNGHPRDPENRIGRDRCKTCDDIWRAEHRAELTARESERRRRNPPTEEQRRRNARSVERQRERRREKREAAGVISEVMATP